MTDRKSLSLVEALERLSLKPILSVGGGDYGKNRFRCRQCAHAWDGEEAEHHAENCAYVIGRALLADAKAQKPVAWLDIESAPKDRPVIVAVERQGDPKWVVGEAHYYEDGEAWYWAGNDPSDSWGGPIYPTYWQPLPAIPAHAEDILLEFQTTHRGKPRAKLDSTKDAP